MGVGSEQQDAGQMPIERSLKTTVPKNLARVTESKVPEIQQTAGRMGGARATGMGPVGARGMRAGGRMGGGGVKERFTTNPDMGVF